ncbi:MAG: hypothetical protein U0939_17805 [Pirellulales bacterium]
MKPFFRRNNLAAVIVACGIVAWSGGDDGCQSGWAAEPVQTIVLIDPALAKSKAEFAEFFKKNPLFFMTRSIKEGENGFSIEHAKVDVEVGNLKTFKQGRYVLRFAKPVPAPRGGDYHYPYALYFRDPTSNKLTLLCQEPIKFAHWREPFPQQLPRLFNTGIRNSVDYFLPPSVMPKGGWQSEGDRFGNLERAPVPTLFPVRTFVKNGENFSEAELHNRLPVKIAIRLRFWDGAGEAETRAAFVIPPGEKRTVAVKTAPQAKSAVRSSSIFIVDEELEPYKAE